MPIWKLTPTNVESTDWQGSTYKGPVVVRAESDKEARELAVSRFVIAVRRVPGQNTSMCPWTQEKLVISEQLENSEYEETGPDEVLFPKE